MARSLILTGAALVAFVFAGSAFVAAPKAAKYRIYFVCFFFVFFYLSLINFMFFLILCFF